MKHLSILLFLFALAGCAEKTVPLANGTHVTQRKYDRMLKRAFRYADRQARKETKGLLSRKQIRGFKHSSVDVVLDTVQRQD